MGFPTPETGISRAPMASPSDAAGLDRALVARIAGGDERALGELYDRHVPLVYAMAYRVLGERADAEEAAAEAAEGEEGAEAEAGEPSEPESEE